MISMNKPKIKIHYSLVILLVISAFTGFLLEFGIILAILSLHEIGHLIMFKFCKGHVSQVTFTLIGGHIDSDYFKLSTISKLLIATGRPYYKCLNCGHHSKFS